MIVTFQNAVPKEDYQLDITMTNTNRLVFDMKPHLDTVQFCPLKDQEVWMNIEVRKTCLRWKGNSKVELSVDNLLNLFKEGKETEQGSSIQEATVKDDWQLDLRMDNGNSLTMDMEELLEFPLFAPLSQKGLWKNMCAQAYSLVWEDKNIRLELPIKSILDYFA